ncbi:MAG: flagellar hook-length control protein FliK, partial [bacterium]
AQARSKRGEEEEGPAKHDQPTDQATQSEIPRTPRETPASTSVVGLAVPTEALVLIRQATGMQPTANSERAGEATQGAMPSTARLATPGDEKALAKPLPDSTHARPNTLQEVETGDAGDVQTTLPRPANTMPRQLATESATGATGSGEDSLKVLRSETHLAPVAQLPPALQIAARVAEAVSTAEAPDGFPNPSDLTAARSLPQPLVKILHVALQPADLGTVVVRMSLRHDALDIQIDASRPGTVDLLQKDRDALSNVLKGSGYSIDGLSIHTLAPDRTGNSMIQQSASQASPSPSAQLQSGASQSDGGWSRSRPQAEDEQQRARGDGAASGRSSGESQTSSLGIYV